MKSDPDVKSVKLVSRLQERLEEEMAKPFADLIKAASAEMEFHAGLKRKFECAASRPWISVLPDLEASEIDLLAMMEKARK